jgi:hypothetical protein
MFEKYQMLWKRPLFLLAVGAKPPKLGALIPESPNFGGLGGGSGNNLDFSNILSAFLAGVVRMRLTGFVIVQAISQQCQLVLSGKAIGMLSAELRLKNI